MLSKEVTIHADGHPTQQSAFKLIPIEKNKRIIKAIKALVILWACAGFAVFIPMLHFVLVPGLFLAGIFFAISGYTDDVRVANNKVACLKCSQTVIIKEQADQFPIWVKCESCSTEYRITATL